MRNWGEFKKEYLIKFWNPISAVIAAGILATYYFGLTGSLWAVTGEFTRWGEGILFPCSEQSLKIGLILKLLVLVVHHCNVQMAYC